MDANEIERFWLMNRFENYETREMRETTLRTLRSLRLMNPPEDADMEPPSSAAALDALARSCGLAGQQFAKWPGNGETARSEIAPYPKNPAKRESAR